MAEKHIVALLIEANKKLLAIIDKLEHDTTPMTYQKFAIDETNNLIRQLDHIVEQLEKSSS